MQRSAQARCVFLLAVTGFAPAANAAVVIDEVQPGFAGDRAGLRPDMRISRIEALDGRIVIDLGSPFELSTAEPAFAGAGAIVHGESTGNAFSKTLGPGDWRFTAVPEFAPDDDREFQDGRATAASGDLNTAVERWRSLAGNLEARGAAQQASWLWGCIATHFARERRDDAAGRAWQQAAKAAGDDRELLASPSEQRAMLLHALGDEEGATRAWRDALDLRVREDLQRARALTELGSFAHRRRELPHAEELLEAALAIRQRLAPATLAIADSYQRLGFTAVERRDLEQATAHFSAAHDITSSVAPAGLVHAATLRGLGVVEAIGGNPTAAESQWREALAIQQALIPAEAATARTLSNLGITAWQQGDLELAETRIQAALAIVEATRPGGLDSAGYLNNLGLIYHRRLQFDKAGEAYKKAAAVFRRVSPDSLELARALTNVALAYGLDGHPEEAIPQLQGRPRDPAAPQPRVH